MVYGGFVLILVVCAAVVIPVAIHRSQSGSTDSPPSPLRGKHTGHDALRLVPPKPPLGRTNLDGYWHANGDVVAGNGKIYRLGTRILGKQWFIWGTCRGSGCPPRTRGPARGDLNTTRVSGRAPTWTATFHLPERVTCGVATTPMPARVTSHWRFTLTPGMTHLRVVEKITAKARCGVARATILWTAMPGRLPAQPTVPPSQLS
jgi:hypothetical protein